MTHFDKYFNFIIENFYYVSWKLTEEQKKVVIQVIL